MSLRKLQEEMKQLITQKELSHSPVKRIEVYREGYVARIAEALQETFETVYKVIGPTDFYPLVGEFIRAFPSHSYNLTDVGGEFPNFLKRIPAQKEFPFLADLAELEWKISRSFHAKWEEPMDENQLRLSLANLEQARFKFQPSMFLQTSTWALLEIRKKRKEDQVEIDVSSLMIPTSILICRKAYQVVTMSIERGQFELLHRLLKGSTMSEAIHHAEDQITEQNITVLFSLLKEFQLMTGIDTTLSNNS